uniref:spermidine synthase n=1 Tax=Fusicatenibacter saccharivorans TaxID=1150298 RepID=UPI0040251939
MERKNRGILKNKLFLYLTEFFSGMSVMAVELGASRLLAPYFSSSQIVWTIIIGTIMIAMALGNIYGGRTADKSPNPDKLYGRIIVAALWIALIPVVGKYIIVGISAVLIFSVNNNFLILAAFVACMVIFVFPLFLLGTVTPSLVKYSVSNLDDNGKTVGTLGAFNTIGSIIGTFVPTFVTIPAVGTSITFLIFAGILLALSIVYFVMEKAGKKKVIASVLIFAFVACMVIFVFPLFLLGTVTPSLVKYSVSNLDDNGKTVGTLGAFNTIGSIIGTFVPTFVTIPAVGTSITFLIFAGILLALSIVYFVMEKAGKKKVIASVLIFAFCCGTGYSDSFVFWENNLTYEGESVYNYLQVYENDERVALSTNVLFGVQSVYMKQDELTGMYYDYAMAAPLMLKDKPTDQMDVLILGMGTGTYATQCKKYFGNMNIEGVEIDEKITDLSRKYFSLSEDIPVTTYDGRAFLNASQKTYDVIMVDAYQDITIPFQMSSKEFFELVKSHLKDDGVMVVNMNMRGMKEGNINQYLSDTIGSVFDTAVTVDVAGSSNRELFASDDPDIVKNLTKHTGELTNVNLKNMMQEVTSNLTEYQKGNYILTDDQAPVELLGMQVIDELIKDEVQYYKDIYKEQGIKGLIESL